MRYRYGLQINESIDIANKTDDTTSRTRLKD